MQRSWSRFLSHLSDHHRSRLSSIVHTVTDAGERYTCDWFGRCGQGRFLVKPASTEEVSEVVKYCNSERIGITTLGGNTGLVGCALAGHGEMILSLEKLNRILEVDPDSGTVEVESGVLLESLQQHLVVHKLTTPYDIGSRGSCTVGGNIATNAGGNNFIRHGPLRAHVLGLEVVLASGEILNLGSRCWKDNSGYDLKQLFIGSEGSLGIITKAILHCPPLPLFKSVALIHIARPFTDSVLHTLRIARESIGESLSAFEFFDDAGLALMSPLPSGMTSVTGGFTVLVEASGGSPVSDRVDAFIEAMGDDASNGVVASDIDGMRKLWHYRESLPVAMARIGPNLKYDVSLPQKEYYRLVESVRAAFGSDPSVAKIVGYGHVGDGNLHLNVALRPGCSLADSLALRISDFVYTRVIEVKGSISAEHGIGRDKLSRLHLSESPGAINLMRTLKTTLDPNGILNPGRTVPM